MHEFFLDQRSIKIKTHHHKPQVFYPFCFHKWYVEMKRKENLMYAIYDIHTMYILIHP